jgi:O-antigen ligase
MNLVWFLTIATVLSVTLGEFGQFPFGSPVSVSVTDILLTLTLMFLFIWKIAIRHDIYFPKEFKILVLFWIVGLIGLPFSGSISGGLYLARFAIYSSSFLIGYFLVIEKRTRFFDVVRTGAIAGLIFLILGFLQLLLVPNFDQLSLLGYDPHQNRLASTFLDPNFAAAFLILSIGISLISFFNSRRKEWLFIIPLLILGLILTFSRSGYLMMFVALTIFGIFKDKRLLLLFIPAILVAIFVPQISERVIGAFTLDASAKSRIDSWQNGLYVFSQSPIFGVGFDNLRYVFSKENLFKTYLANGGNSGAGVDSSFVLVLATTGIMGTGVFVYWWFLIVKSFFQKRTSSGLILAAIFIGLLVNSQFINSLFYPPIMLMIYITAGIFIGLKKSKL